MPSVRVVLVSPRNDGNVGAVARSMANFGLRELCMVNPCELTDEAFKRAKHAGDILRSARTVTSFEEALEDASLIVGTSGIVTQGEKHFVRIPMTPRQLAERLVDFEEEMVILFGPEDTGLAQEQLLRCDILVHIPAHEDYPILNLSHAVTVVLYELFESKVSLEVPRKANGVEKEKLLLFFDELLDAIDYPDFRKEKTKVMFRRLMGRAVPTKWEFYTIMGVLGDAAKKIRCMEKK